MTKFLRRMRLARRHKQHRRMLAFVNQTPVTSIDEPVLLDGASIVQALRQRQHATAPTTTAP